MQPSDEVALSVRRTLRAEAHRNELRLAKVRLVVLALVAAFDLGAYLVPTRISHMPRTDIGIPLLSAGWLIVAAVAWKVLERRTVRPALHYVLPALDSLVPASIAVNYLRVVGRESFRDLHALTSFALGTSLFITGGALRFSAAGAVMTTLLGCATFAGVALWVEPPAQVLYNVALLVGTGTLAVWTTGVVHRATRSEVGRIMLRRFLPDHVVESAHEDPVGLLAEPRTVEATILVTDLRGFTGFAESKAPKEVLAFLNRMQGAFAATVRRHGGMVDKFMGDGMLAVFGASITKEPRGPVNHAAQAIEAALGILCDLGIINAEEEAAGRRPIGIGIGIHTGTVVAGCLGLGARLELTVIGDTVNTASRLEGLTKERGVTAILSAEVVEALDESLRRHVTALGEAPIRGRRDPIRIYGLSP